MPASVVGQIQWHVCMPSRPSALHGEWGVWVWVRLSLPIGRGEWLRDRGLLVVAIILVIEYRAPHHGESEVR